MRFEVLGPLRVEQNGKSLPLGGPRQRLVLATLIAARGRTVSTSQLIDAVWDEDPPSTARKTLQGYVHHLRSEIGDSLRTEGGGYALDTDGNVDAEQFAEFHRQGKELIESDPGRASEILTEALNLWTGQAYADLRDNMALAPETTRLEDLRLTVLGDRIDIDLSLGRHQALIGEIEGLTHEYPLQERFRAQHMLALYRAGRQVEALRSYDHLRRYLADEIGVEPSAELRELEERVIAQDDSLLIEARDLATGAKAIRGYELRDLVSQTASASSYLGYQRSVGRQVRITVLGPEIADDPDFIASFLVDTQRVAELEHPNLSYVFDTWREPGAAYQVSRWLDGGTLTDRIGELSQSKAMAVLDEVGRALSHAHRAGVFHGAITTDAVQFDAGGHAYLADFSVGRPAIERSMGTDVRAFAALVGDLIPEMSSVIGDVEAGRIGSVSDVLRRVRQSFGVDVVPMEQEAVSTAGARNPYKGLRAFQAIDSSDFFGRDELVERMVRAVDRHRLVAVIGPSGSGKSSAVKAGLIPHLTDDADHHRFIAEMFPGSYPFEELETALLSVGVNRPAVIDDLTADDRGLLRVVKQILPGDDSELILVIDQFEELFSLVASDDVRMLFLDSLVNAVNDTRGRLRVVLTMRADFFDRPLEHAAFGELLDRGLVPVTALSDTEMAAAIAGPAAAVGVEFEPGLIPRIVGDVSGEPGALPLLQYVLTELFEDRGDGHITTDSYERTGGVMAALGQRGEDLYTSLSDSGQAAIRHALLRLVTVDESSDDLRRRERRSRLTAPGVDETGLNEALHIFGANRLLTFDQDPVTRGPTVEVAHEALLREWPRLRGWVDDHRDDLVTRRRLGQAMDEWRASGEDSSYLPTGSRLAQFEGWAQDTSLALSPDEHVFLEAGLDAERKREVRASRRRRRTLTGLTVAAIVLAVVAIFAVIQRGIADQRTAEAETGRISSQAAVFAESNPTLALLLAAEAYNRDPGVPGLGALQQVLVSSDARVSTFGSGAIEVEWVPGRIVALRSDGVDIYNDADFSIVHEVGLPVRLQGSSVLNSTADTDGVVSTFAVSNRYAAVGIADGQLSLIDLETGAVQALTQGNVITAVEFSPDGGVIGIGDDLGTTVLYSLPSLDRIVTIESPDPERSFADFPQYEHYSNAILEYETQSFRGIAAVAFSENGDMVATSFGPRVRVWDGASGTEVGAGALVDTFDYDWPYFAQDLRFIDGEIFSWGFGTVTRLDGETGELLSVTNVPTSREPGDLTFNIAAYELLTPERALAIVSDGRLVEFNPSVSGYVRDPISSSNLIVSHQEGIALSPSGDRYVVAGADALMVGSVETDYLLAETYPRNGAIWLGVTADGRHVSADNGPEATSWSRDTGEPAELPWASTYIQAGFGETRLWVAGIDQSGWLYDTIDPASETALIENFNPALPLAISPDGTQLAHGRCQSGTFVMGETCDFRGVNVVDLSSLSVVELFPDAVHPESIAWSSDGSTLVMADLFGRVTAWDTSDWSELDLDGFTGISDVAFVVAYSPDGRFLASFGESGLITLRSSDTAEVIREIPASARGGAAEAARIWFSPDGSLLMATVDGTGRLFDTSTGSQLGGAFPTDPGVIPGASIGTQLNFVTAQGEQILVWNLDTSTWFDIACQAAGRNMTRAEWEQFGPSDTEYQATCPQYPIEP